LGNRFLFFFFFIFIIVLFFSLIPILYIIDIFFKYILSKRSVVVLMLAFLRFLRYLMKMLISQSENFQQKSKRILRTLLLSFLIKILTSILHTCLGLNGSKNCSLILSLFLLCNISIPFYNLFFMVPVKYP
jgi:hypothetical protein